MRSFVKILFVIVALFAFACKSEIEVYRIGAVVPLSGGADAYGQVVKNGLMLALEEVNKQGGINGKPMDILFEDDKSDEKSAVGKVEELSKAAPLIIGGVTSNIALAIAPVCGQKKVVCISPSASSPKLSGVSPYFFRNYPSDTLEGHVMAEYAVRKMKIGSVAILYVDNEYGQGLDSVFKQRFQELQGTITTEKGYPKGTTDFSAMIRELKSAPSDAVYLPGYFDEVGGLLKEIKAQKLNVKLISSGGFASPQVFDTAGEAAEGVVFPQPPYDPKSTDHAIETFVTAYKRKFYSEPNVYAAYAYDAFKIVAKVVASCANYPTDLRQRMADVSGFKGLTGDISFDSNGDVDVTPRMFVVKGGAFQPLD